MLYPLVVSSPCMLQGELLASASRAPIIYTSGCILCSWRQHCAELVQIDLSLTHLLSLRGLVPSSRNWRPAGTFVSASRIAFNATGGVSAHWQATKLGPVNTMHEVPERGSWRDSPGKQDV
eukprot:951698-Pelagomonas_calceolata.AAC.1